MNCKYLLFPMVACVALSASMPCLTHKGAKRLAEDATGGEAVRSRKVPANGSIHAWEVLVHLPGGSHGWRVTIDRDNGKILKKEAIDNPPAKKPRS